MKVLSVALLLMASLAFGLLGCSDNTTQLTSPILLSGNGTASLGKIVERPLTDYLNAQTWGSVWNNGDNLKYLYYVDYAGAWDKGFGLGIGSTFSGNITERPLADGTAEVTVDYRSHNVLSYMRLYDPIYDPGPYPLVLGEGLFDVVGGATASLGDIHFKIVFINTAPGAPLPDFSTDKTKSIMMEASVFGPLHVIAGMGPDGTPGHGWTNQTGLFQKILRNLKPVGEPGTEIYTSQAVHLQKVGATK